MANDDSCCGCLFITILSIILIAIGGPVGAFLGIILLIIVGYLCLNSDTENSTNKNRNTYNSNTQNQNSYNNNNNYNNNNTLPYNNNNYNNNNSDDNNCNSNNDTKPENNNIKKIDINTAGINEIKNLPGIGLISAKKLIQMRENGNYVESMSDLGNKLNLKPYQIEQLKPYLTISKIKTKKSSYSRKVDL